MKIEKDLVVTFSYILKDRAGTEVERSSDDDPMAYLHGHGVGWVGYLRQGLKQIAALK